MIQRQDPSNSLLPPETIFRARFGDLPLVQLSPTSDSPFDSFKSGGTECLSINNTGGGRQLGAIAIRRVGDSSDVTIESVMRMGRRTPQSKGAFLATYLKLASIMEMNGNTLVSGLVQTTDSHRLWRIMEDAGVARLDEEFFDASISGSGKVPRTGRYCYYGGKFSILPSVDVEDGLGC